MERIVAGNGVVYYRSELLSALGVRHGFSTRIGGVSPPPFDTLNLGNPAGCSRPDPDTNLKENFQRFYVAVGLPGDHVGVHQVHGCAVARIVGGRPDLSQADAIVTKDPQTTVAIRTADCAAVLIASADGRTIAAVHAGWRGVVAEVIPAAIQAMRDLGAPPVAAAIFPAISFENFEVGLEVVTAFNQLGLPAKALGDGKGRADVPGGCEQQLRRAGIEQIDRSSMCTHTRADEFFSHRRDGGATGRMALLALPGQAVAPQPRMARVGV